MNDRTVCVYGVGSSHFGKQPDTSPSELAWTAVAEALGDAGVDSVDAVYVGTVFGAPGVAQRALHALGIVEVPILTLENACASGTTAYHEAFTAVGLGRYERVLVLGVEKMTAAFDGAIHPEDTDAEGRSGLALPALYAMSAARYVHEHGLTPEQLALVSVKNHRHALGNPRAQYRGDHTVEEVLASRLIADPLTLLQCCPIADGAAAAVLGPDRGEPRDIRIRSSVLRSGALWDETSPHVWGFDLVAATARDAFDQSGVGVSDADLFEVHDAFTIGEIVTTEALGLAEPGGGGRLVESGHTTIGGPQPVNPSGGLLSRGHPLGCTGVAQVAEVVWQLRGEADARQVGNARIGVVETMGGGVAGIDGNACVVSVLERPHAGPGAR
ncbi:MAG TPA: thiolase family protein [Iamia sp.]|nr:thiolase family protein [Iamia sp.]